ncbi:hypothetical protein ACKAV7_011991 [Fusarium commune]
MNLIGVPIPFPDDAMPPEGQYSSREELVTAINAWAAPRGYAFSVKSSVVTPSGRTRVIYSCDRGAGKAPKVKPAKERKRKTTTRRTGCQFSIAAKESLCKTVWSLTHRPGPGFDRHNHEPSFSERAHPVHRHLSSPDRSTVHKLSNAGIEPRKIQSYLHLNSDTLATQQDIYNYIAQGKRELAKGQSNMHALANELENEGFWSQICLDESSRVTYCKPGFTRDKDDVQGQEKWDTFYKHWHGIVASTTEDIYMERLEKFKQQYSPDHLNEVGYIIETWLELYKERVSPPAPTPLAAAPALRADDPRAIYQRYKEAREAWYATVPRGGLRTNQQYRKAMGLPARYSKIELQWCLNYKQMGSRCREKSGTREWTKEEQFSYLDWDKAENERVEQNVGEEMAEKPFLQRRGMQHIWDAAERDVLQQGGGA